MKVGSTSVALVLDPDYGECLSALAAKMCVWIVDSAANTKAAREFRVQPPEPEHLVTTFKPDSFVGLMENIELHHGGYSQTPPFHNLEVVGQILTQEIRQVLDEYEFKVSGTTDRGSWPHVFPTLRFLGRETFS